ncbi:hypothetical protein [Sporosarcina sp. G11-34]|uniref:hypothetical protein n=1 Tax=Sporosarcina sp. G11-34 TaxID=2849605 RepID=UPI0022A8F805|nr:hypothetical protein [Sporosarcina sp. G11-34]MCZ2258262.1 hypothetical protein [Sporosarcina sp. G11-34]
MNSLPRNPDIPTAGYYEFDTIKYIKMSEMLLGIKGFDYEFTSGQSLIESIIDQGSKIDLLVFKVLDEELDKIIFDQDLEKWTFNDNGEVISK